LDNVVLDQIIAANTPTVTACPFRLATAEIDPRPREFRPAPAGPQCGLCTGRTWKEVPHRSYCRRGDCWDNSAIESFFASLKKERVYRKVYRTRDEGRADIFDYIEAFYNSRRRHSKLGQISPNEFERSYAGLA
jgi:putative transposase